MLHQCLYLKAYMTSQYEQQIRTRLLQIVYSLWMLLHPTSDTPGGARRPISAGTAGQVPRITVGIGQLHVTTQAVTRHRGTCYTYYGSNRPVTRHTQAVKCHRGACYMHLYIADI